MKKYRKKPIEIEAAQWDGKKIDNMYPIAFFKDHDVDWRYYKQENLIIETVDGPMTVPPGSWIIKGIRGELYACRQDIFEESYEEV